MNDDKRTWGNVTVGAPNFNGHACSLKFKADDGLCASIDLDLAAVENLAITILKRMAPAIATPTFH